MGTRNNAELARFLRTRREQVTPEQVGLPAGGRRRTPGLRREEVAARAHVGATWYTWVEQGRDVNPSPEVLCAVADALLLDPGERDHVLRLAGHPPGPPAVESGAAATVQPVLDALLPNPAAVLNARGDMVLYNLAFRFLITDVEQFPPEDRNCLWLDFTDELWLGAYVADRQELEAVVARTRALYASSHADPAWEQMLSRLQAASPLFAQLWNAGLVLDAADWEKTIRNPRVGELRLQVSTFNLRDRPSLRMLTYLPKDDVTRERLTRIVPPEHRGA
ncbi:MULTISPECIES: helix-turn-helix transcriptional regulator [Tsukamurella]|nr:MULTISPECIES: helix-turn-helix transcriptional regulator [Tsukamurella]NMD56527.1 helix-turn-helix domain-containing protein [Tsukamurella columbiensis]